MRFGFQNPRKTRKKNWKNEKKQMEKKKLVDLVPSGGCERVYYESFPKFRLRKWRVRNWLGTPVGVNTSSLLNSLVPKVV